MGFQDVAFLPSCVSFTTSFKKNCGRGEGFRTTTCFRIVVEGKQGYASCKILSLQQGLLFVSFQFHRDHKTVTTLR